MPNWLTGNSGTAIQTVCAVVALIVTLSGFTLREFIKRRPKVTPQPLPAAPPQTPEQHLLESEDEARKEAEAVLSLEDSFPSGLYLLDYQPGIRFKIRGCTPTKIFDWQLPVFAFIVLTTVGLLPDNSLNSPNSAIPTTIFEFILATWFWISRKLRGSVVKINIRNRSYFVSMPPGTWGGGWPPEILVTTKFDSTTSKWTTSLYILNVQSLGYLGRKP